MTQKQGFKYGIIGCVSSVVLYLFIQWFWPIPPDIVDYYGHGWQGGVLWMLAVVCFLGALLVVSCIADRLINGSDVKQELKPMKDTSKPTSRRRRVFTDEYK